MIAGRCTFDTTLMEIAQGKLITKAGAEGFQGTGLFPGSIPGDANGYGLVVKIAEGDISGHFRENSESAEGRARPVVTIEALRQLEALSPNQITSLAPFDRRGQFNWMKLKVGSFVPAFQLDKH
jgi:L-asparaginase II